MSSIAKNNDLVFTGHACDSITKIKATCQSVFVNGSPIARIYDPLLIHNILVGDSCVPHISKINIGSKTVFAEGLGVARVGDSADQGAIIDGSTNCFSN